MKAFELLSEPRAWTQNAYARDAAGDELAFPGLLCGTDAEHAAGSKRAVCWDILGAIIRCYPNAEQREAAVKKVAKKLQAEPPRRALCEFNDAPHRTHADVVELLKKLDV